MDSSDRGHLLQGLDGATSWAERPIRRISGSDRLNPLPHAGTISVFLLAVVIVSGLYITLFFQYGYEASYQSVLDMERHPIQRVVRALHRYSSAALVVTTVVHAWRIFVAGRFAVRRRRWRWLTGVATLLVLWPAGVSGYLLVWDTRAGAVAEAIGRTMSFSPPGVAWWARHFSGATGSSGSSFMLVVWFVHLLLTVVVGYFAFRHLRRSSLAWYPARHWMLAMGGALMVASLFLPLGMLDPADGSKIGFDLPLDPFVLFLLPVLESNLRWLGLVGLTVVAGLVAGLSFLIRRSDPTPVVVLAESCTGCNLCVIDCPYGALSMVPRENSPTEGSADDEADSEVHHEDDNEAHHEDDNEADVEAEAEVAAHWAMVAVVDDAACTSCGICLGSCAFQALSLDGIDPIDPELDADLSGRTVVIACDRHAVDSAADKNEVVRSVRCAGVVGPDLIRSLTSAGAEGIEVVGCAPDDCRYGVGNTMAEERIDGERAPHIARAHRSMVGHQWVAPGEVDLSLTSHRVQLLESAGPDEPSDDRRALVGSASVVLVSALAIAVATAAPFSSESADAAIQVIVDQEPGLGLTLDEDFVDEIESIDVAVDGTKLGSRPTAQWNGNRVAVEEWTVEPGAGRVEVRIAGPTAETAVFADEVELAPNQQLQIVVRSQSLAPVADDGRKIFLARQSGCSVCHSVEQGEHLVGPSLYGVATRAETRVEGLDARTYLWQSILLPDEYVVDGYPAGQMLPIYRERLSQEELDALIAYMLTLTEEIADSEGGDS